MSRQNVELAREALEAFIRGDTAQALSAAHPDVVTFRAPPLPDSQTYHGRAGVLQAWTDWTAQFGDFEMSAGESVDAGDRVVVEILQRGVGQVSGATVEARFWLVYTIADGQIVRLDIFQNEGEALEAAGLRP
ncbi:MAG TPA: nuclear transport factor 2 family protein [Thermoleophilaceae bacterium]|nr:nuclear transport factor 2 family protein [Thermoleophilaceae bacterium]